MHGFNGNFLFFCFQSIALSCMHDSMMMMMSMIDEVVKTTTGTEKPAVTGKQ